MPSLCEQLVIASSSRAKVGRDGVCMYLSKRILILLIFAEWHESYRFRKEVLQ